MREIKFRAWHEKWNRLIYEIYLGDNEVKFPIGNTNDILDINEEYSNLIFQQYTGLKDANGREIYEGDIVYSEEYDRNFAIEYAGDWSCFAYNTAASIMDRILSLDRAGLYSEVIGNIYENPELLEASHASK